jgi:hypothetical protein
LGLERAECRSQPSSALSARVPIDQAAELGHCAAGVLELMLVQVHQCKSDADVILCCERMRAETVELDRGALRFLEGPRQQLRSAVVASTLSAGLRARSA